MSATRAPGFAGRTSERQPLGGLLTNVRGGPGRSATSIGATSTICKVQTYHYFGSKDRLFDAVWQAVVEQERRGSGRKR